ncbi:hypothetical protein AMTRI_Chr07g81760 [Amborella trichopoda]|uniref:MPN domain-containing protein n=1 Tax=Amborella trichopoda TaxID=13333 RepID=W1NI66_AMBTC|nr:ER membrane protein complex subunit 8/9 homolog [Amborella trichopoda]ERM95163.1 hypothetical protein AMTR_s00009p00262730 [Amborella trichopoda]|eukprot:XP_006827747.1 ER membrane protein complex subunit 8/9 homolog [Amborella trichopoda]
MASGCRYELKQNAYMKVVLHALKYNTTSVNGILVGREPSSSSSSMVEIVDAIPLSHSLIGLLPPLEIALMLVEEYFAGEGLSIIGYYHANERYNEFELPNIAKRIGEHISRYFPQAAVLLLDNKKLEAISEGKSREPVVQLYTKDSAKGWQKAGTDSNGLLVLKEPSANLVLWDHITSGKHHEIVDFDDHLDNISKDWLNPNLFI